MGILDDMIDKAIGETMEKTGLSREQLTEAYYENNKEETEKTYNAILDRVIREKKSQAQKLRDNLSPEGKELLQKRNKTVGSTGSSTFWTLFIVGMIISGLTFVLMLEGIVPYGTPTYISIIVLVGISLVFLIVSLCIKKSHNDKIRSINSNPEISALNIKINTIKADIPSELIEARKECALARYEYYFYTLQSTITIDVPEKRVGRHGLTDNESRYLGLHIDGILYYESLPNGKTTVQLEPGLHVLVFDEVVVTKYSDHVGRRANDFTLQINNKNGCPYYITAGAKPFSDITARPMTKEEFVEELLNEEKNFFYDI